MERKEQNVLSGYVLSEIELYSWKKVKTLLGYYPNTSQFKLAQLIVNY
jgi:hypothetical protein